MINSVRNTVLSVLNKNNYGYISPADFNLFAKQAQMELYEEYFSNYNKAIAMENARQVGTDYADISKPLAETLDTFLVQDFLYPVTSPNGLNAIRSKFRAPDSTYSFGEAYMINRLTCWKLITSGVSGAFAPSSFLTDPSKDFASLGVKVGDFLVNLSSNVWTTVLQVSTNVNPNDTLALNEGTINPATAYRVLSHTEGYDAERVTNGNIRMLNSSLLTKPNELFPAYTQEEIKLIYNPLTQVPTIIKAINLYPDTNNYSGYGALYCTYFRYPKDPKWTYISLSGGEPAFNSSAIDYQDFEMPLEDEYKLAMKILQYCGISIREIQVAQFAIAQEQHEQPSFSMQQ